jgi:lipoprotein-anchoring transpeptidase ErfK/SrfK
MAVYPGGYNELRAARVRTIFYIIGVVIIVGIVGVAGYFLLRQRGGAQETPPTAQPQTAEQSQPKAQAPAQERVEPSAIVPAAAEPTPAAPAAFTADANPGVSALIAQAMALVNQQGGGSKVIEARDRFNEILPMAGGEQRAFAKEQLTALADKWLFSKGVYPEDKLCTSYKVNSGDLLANIGKQHNVPYEILMQINNISKPELLQAGAVIKVINGPFNARVYRSTFTMDLYLQNTYVKSFAVGLGKPGMETPKGRWRVKADGKLIKPIWTDPVSGRTYHPEDPDYPLGSRWIALEGIEGDAVGKKGFAIHGTKDPGQIGTPGSQGCIRLHNGDAVTVYNLMMPERSLVDVVD